MNMILLFNSDFTSDTQVKLMGRRFDHVMTIIRAEEGDELIVGRINGKIGKGVIKNISHEALEMDVDLDQDPPKALPVTLLLALPRPLVFKRVLQSVTALGVKKIIIFQSNRVEKSFWLSPVVDEKAIKEQLILGLEQTKDTVLPEVVLKKRFKPFAEDDLPDIIAGKRAILAHPGEGKKVLQRFKEESVLAVGPEGGFIPYEVEKFVECGFEKMNLGKRILKVETAVPVLLSRFLG